MFLIKRIKRKKIKEYRYNKINKFMLTDPYYINSIITNPFIGIKQI